VFRNLLWIQLYVSIPLFFVQFLRLRYAVSEFTRSAFFNMRVQLDGVLLGGRVPPVMERSYTYVRNMLIVLGNQLVPHPVQQQQGR
jgi:hypothetical protein